MNTRPAALAVVALLAAFGVSRSARASVVVPQTLEQLARRATAVVRGVVVAQAASVDPATRRSVVGSTVRVVERWKGAPPDVIEVRQLGRFGRGGKLALVEGDARLTPGEDVVLFLAEGRGAEAGVWFILGFAQGKLAVRRDPRGVERLERENGGLGFVGGKIEAQPTRLPDVAALVRRVAAETP